MKRFYLTGHYTFSNRGCEAIVRSTVMLLRRQFGSVEVLVPSSNISADRALWPEAGAYGVRFIQAYLPAINRYWTRLQGLPLPPLKRANWPFPFPRGIRKALSEVDAVLSVGGDNYSLDYQLPSLLMAFDRLAMDLGKPVVLWGASVGPFDTMPSFEAVIKRHLSRMAFVAARETKTVDYLTALGIGDRVVLAADPAFALEAEPVDPSSYWPDDLGGGVLGVNVSPLLLRYVAEGRATNALAKEIARFIHYAVEERGLGVLLIPHVIYHVGGKRSDDQSFIAQCLPLLGDLGMHVRVMDTQLNAAQIKHVIGQCRYFVGARTHSTIAAISSGVPTASIAYSLKARGLNCDIFGSMRYLVEASCVSADMLTEKLTQLEVDERSLRVLLKQKQLEIQGRVELLASELTRYLADNRVAQV